MEAFAEVKNNPERYARPFKTMIPKKTWIGGKKVRELQELANDLGGHMANWVEQALEWAQRIANGETWEIVCDDIEILSNHSRIIIWKDGFARSVGGECDCYPLSSASQVDFYNSYSLDKMCADVPNVVLYD